MDSLIRRKKKFNNFYRKKNILIPGGAGFIGSNLAKRLVLYGAKVTIVDSLDILCGSNLFNLKDVKNKILLLKSKIEDFLLKSRINKYDIIFNCIGLTNHRIGYSDPAIDYRINCASGLELMKKIAREKSKNRMISIGSRSQYGRSNSIFIDESQPMNPLDVQAIHKIALEQYNNFFASFYGLDLLYVRLTNVYGPGQRLRGDGIGVIGEIVRNSIMSKELIVYGSTDRIKDILFVDDVVEALLSLGMMDGSGFAVYNIGGQPCRINELLHAINKCIKVKVKVIPFPEKIKNLDTGDAVLNIDRLRKDTGWIPKTDVDEGIIKTIDYYFEHKGHYL